MTDELVAGAFVLLGVVLAGVFNTFSGNKSWLRQERLEAYRAFTAAAYAFMENPCVSTRDEFTPVYERFRITATYRQFKHGNDLRHHLFGLLALRENVMTEREYEDDRSGFVEDYVQLHGRLAYETQAAIGVRVRLPLPERVETYLRRMSYSQRTLAGYLFVCIALLAAVIVVGLALSLLGSILGNV